jgi:hypothetical protein
MTSIRPNVSGREQNILKKHAVCAMKRASQIKVHSPHDQYEGFSKLCCSILLQRPLGKT